jgi:starch synthase
MLSSPLQGEFNALRDQLMRSYPDRAALFFQYDEPLSHLIYAAADMFVVPSMFEPCGLTQVGLGLAGWLAAGAGWLAG